MRCDKCEAYECDYLYDDSESFCLLNIGGFRPDDEMFSLYREDRNHCKGCVLKYKEVEKALKLAEDYEEHLWSNCDEEFQDVSEECKKKLAELGKKLTDYYNLLLARYKKDIED